MLQKNIGKIFLKFFSFIINLFNLILKKEKVNELIFLQDNNATKPNIRLEKIVKSLNKKKSILIF